MFIKKESVVGKNFGGLFFNIYFFLFFIIIIIKLIKLFINLKSSANNLIILIIFPPQVRRIFFINIINITSFNMLHMKKSKSPIFLNHIYRSKNYLYLYN